MNTGLVCKAGSKLACASGKIGKAGSMALFEIGKHSPEIMIGVGVIGVIGASIWASRQTYLHAKDILDTHELSMMLIKEAGDLNDPKYGPREIIQEKIDVYLKTAKSFLVVYGPSVSVGILSLSFLVGANLILKRRNIALAAAYALIQKAFKEYRDRVVEELGPEKDFHFRYNTDYETVTEEITDESGKTKKVKKTIQVLKNDAEGSIYARIFDRQVFDTNGGYTGSSQWSPSAEYNASSLVFKCRWANQRLEAKGYLFLNEVYEELGFPLTKAGQVVGWLHKGDGDGVVSFGNTVDSIINGMPGYLAYRDGSPILLDFNVDGPILDIF